MRPMLLVTLFVVLCLGLATQVAYAYKERDIESPVRPGPVPPIDRVNPHRVVVCKPSSQPTAAQLADIQSRLATATGDALAQARAEAAWQRKTQLFGECRFQHPQDAVNAAGKHANEHGVYVVDSDGYIYDRLIGSYNKEYVDSENDHSNFPQRYAVIENNDIHGMITVDEVVAAITNALDRCVGHAETPTPTSATVW